LYRVIITTPQATVVLEFSLFKLDSLFHKAGWLPILTYPYSYTQLSGQLITVES